MGIVVDLPRNYRARVIAMSNGDPHNARAHSGVLKHLFHAMEAEGYLTGVFSSLPSTAARRCAQLASFAPSKRAWRQRYQMSMGLVRAFERTANNRLRKYSDDAYDAMFQFGAYCNVSKLVHKPIFSFHDGDVLTTVRYAPEMRGLSEGTMSVRRRAQYEKSVFDSVERIFTASEWIGDMIAANYSIPRERIEFVGAGSNLDEASLSGPRDYTAAHALFIGLDFKRKGGRELLEAFRRVRAQLPSARLTIVGGIPAGEVQPGVRSLGRIFGPDRSERLAGLLRSASVFVMPSRWEPFGLVFLEAMAAALPCIGVNRYAMPEIIGETGALVSANDPRALADALYELLSDPIAAAQRGTAARERYLQRYGWKKTAARIGTAIEQHLRAN